MFFVCSECGMYNEEHEVAPDGSYIICPHCQHAARFLQLPLFVITGPSGAGKSTACVQMAGKFQECVILEQDILWLPGFANAEDNYRSYRSIWLRMALNIQQSGRPVALFGTVIPEQYESLPLRRYFSAIHYLSLVCDDAVLEQRLRSRPAWRKSHTDEVVQEMLRFNRWLKEHADKTKPPMTLLDTSSISVEETIAAITQWIRQYLPR